MAIEMTCPGCGKRLRVPDSAAGKKGKCPFCGTLCDIPLPTEEASGEEKGQAKVRARPKATTRRPGVAAPKRPAARSTSKLPPKLQRRAATAKFAAKRAKQEPKRREYDPEAAAKRKKRQLIILLVVVVAIIVGLILSHIFYFGPIKRRFVTWKRAMDATSSYLTRFGKEILNAVPLQALPEDSLTLRRLADRAKRLFQKYQRNIESAGVKDVIENIFKKSKLYEFCSKLPKMTANLVATLDSILTEKQDAIEEGRKNEWEEQKPEAMRRYLAAYTNIEKPYVLACYMWDAWNMSFTETHWVDKDWREWTQRWIDKEMSGYMATYGGG